MKPEEIKAILAQQFQVKDPAELNAVLRTPAALKIKFILRGKKIGHLGYTTNLKAITAEGLKIIDGKRVRLIRFAEIETFKKAEAKAKRPAQAKASATSPAPIAKKPAKDKALAKEGTAKKSPGVSQSLFIPPSKSR
jgi:hypothetical protein